MSGAASDGIPPVSAKRSRGLSGNVLCSWDGRLDAGASTRPRMHEQLSAHAAQPLLHAQETQSLRGFNRSGIKSCSPVRNPQAQRPGNFVEFDKCLAASAVLVDIPNRFLRHTEEAQGSVLGKFAGQAGAGELNSHGIAIGEFPAKVI